MMKSRFNQERRKKRTEKEGNDCYVKTTSLFPKEPEKAFLSLFGVIFTGKTNGICIFQEKPKKKKGKTNSNFEQKDNQFLLIIVNVATLPMEKQKHEFQEIPASLFRAKSVHKTICFREHFFPKILL